jgi:hypothetical protein
MHHAHQIDVDRPAPILQRNIVSAAGAAHTGVIAQHMHFAEGIYGGLRGPLDVGIVAYIAHRTAHGGQIAFEGRDRLFQRLRLDIGKHDAHARLGERTTHSESDAAGAAGHERCFSVKIAHTLKIPSKNAKSFGGHKVGDSSSDRVRLGSQR